MQLTATQIEGLTQKIYLELLDLPGVGMGEMGECKDKAETMVREWMDAHDITEGEESTPIIEKMGEYLSVDDDNDYPLIINALTESLTTQPDTLIDSVMFVNHDNDMDFIPVWEKVQNVFSVREFCNLVGIDPETI